MTYAWRRRSIIVSQIATPKSIGKIINKIDNLELKMCKMRPAVAIHVCIVILLLGDADIFSNV